MWLGAAATPERIRKIETAKEERFRCLVREKGILPLSDAVAWVHRLNQRGWLQAIASSAPLANVEAVLAAMGIASYFKGIVSAEALHTPEPLHR